MKKTITMLLLVLMLLSMAAFAASEEQEEAADALNGLGLFQGTDNGYELDRAPNRAEALTMLIRLLGKESEALAYAGSCPLTDVAGRWMAPYVGWAYAQGLTNGVTETSFEPDGIAQGKMYATFVLRALGYSDVEGDFTYNRAVEAAADLGIAPAGGYGDSFTRGDAVLMSYKALSLPYKSGQQTLLEGLIAAGAVDAEAAGGTKEADPNAFAVKHGWTFVEPTKISVPVNKSVVAAYAEDFSVKVTYDAPKITRSEPDENGFVTYTVAISSPTEFDYWFEENEIVDGNYSFNDYILCDYYTGTCIYAEFPTINEGERLSKEIETTVEYGGKEYTVTCSIEAWIGVPDGYINRHPLWSGVYSYSGTTPAGYLMTVSAPQEYDGLVIGLDHISLSNLDDDEGIFVKTWDDDEHLENWIFVRLDDYVAIDAGSCGDSLNWTISADGVLTVYGNGGMWYGSYSWWDYREAVRVIRLPEGLTEISDYVFNYFDAVTDVYYGGSESDWKNVIIGTLGNEILANATIHFNSTGPN